MSNEEGVQFIYTLANSDVSQEEKIGVLKSHITEYIFNVLEYGAYHLTEVSHVWYEDEIYEYSPEQPVQFFNHDFLITMFSSILHTVNWDVIINYHKEQKELDTRYEVVLKCGQVEKRLGG